MSDPKETCCKPSGMGLGAKIGIVAVLILAIGAAMYAKNIKPARPVVNESNPPAAQALPKLLDLGATKCIPCKMMIPVLDELKKEYAGKLEVVFIDVWENKEAGEPYGYRSIPTQIFFDAGGKELFRHEGFFAKKDILAKWKELGIDLGAPELTATPK